MHLCMCYYYKFLHNNRDIHVQSAETSYEINLMFTNVFESLMNYHLGGVYMACVTKTAFVCIKSIGKFMFLVILSKTRQSCAK